MFSDSTSALGNLKQDGSECKMLKLTAPSKDEETSTVALKAVVAGWLQTLSRNGWMEFMTASNFLRVQPLYTSHKSGLFQVWDYMRTLIFSIGFVFLLFIHR